METSGDARGDALEKNAEALRDQAERLEDRAETVRDTAESRADAIEAADMNVGNMPKEQRDAIVANEAPAVR